MVYKFWSRSNQLPRYRMVVTELNLMTDRAAAPAGRGVQFRHLVHRYVLSLLDGCWGQTRYAGGPTQAQLRGCLSFSWPSRPGGYALTW